MPTKNKIFEPVKPIIRRKKRVLNRKPAVSKISSKIPKPRRIKPKGILESPSQLAFDEELKASEGFQKVRVQYRFTPIEQEKWQQKLQNIIDLHKTQTVSKKNQSEDNLIIEKKEKKIDQLAVLPNLPRRASTMDFLKNSSNKITLQKEIAVIEKSVGLGEFFIMLLGIIFLLMLVITIYNYFQLRF